MSKETINQFFQDILQEEDLQNRLSNAYDMDSFVTIALEISEENGYNFTREEIIADIQSAQNQDEILLLSEDELEAMSDNTKPWKRFVYQLHWARGRNYELWSKIQKRK